MDCEAKHNQVNNNLDDIHVTAKDGRTIAIVHGIEGWLMSATIIKALRAAYACGHADALAEAHELETAREGAYCLERR